MIQKFSFTVTEDLRTLRLALSVCHLRQIIDFIFLYLNQGLNLDFIAFDHPVEIKKGLQVALKIIQVRHYVQSNRQIPL